MRQQDQTDIASTTIVMNSEELNIEFMSVKDAAYRYAASLLHDYLEAEDIVQDLYEKLWRRRLLLHKSRFRSLVITSIRNMCLDALRRRERLRQTIVATPTEAISSNEEESNTELTSLIEHIISQLPDREREVMHLRDCEQMEFEDIASIVGITESAARMALSRARQKVRDELSKVMSYGL